uniref:Uncharacterized protein n=1 Tax=Electrophorus electricus TaxID=8005 RepID=A0A4W4E5Y0_ELEEL
MFHCVDWQAVRLCILTGVKGRFESLDVSGHPRDAVDADLLHTSTLDLLQALADDVGYLRTPLYPCLTALLQQHAGNSCIVQAACY